MVSIVKPQASPRLAWREDVRNNWRAWAEFIRIVRMHRGPNA